MHHIPIVHASGGQKRDCYETQVPKLAYAPLITKLPAGEPEIGLHKALDNAFDAPRELLVRTIGMATKVVEGVFYSMIHEVVSCGVMVFRYDSLLSEEEARREGARGELNRLTAL